MINFNSFLPLNFIHNSGRILGLEKSSHTVWTLRLNTQYWYEFSHRNSFKWVMSEEKVFPLFFNSHMRNCGNSFNMCWWHWEKKKSWIHSIQRDLLPMPESSVRVGMALERMFTNFFVHNLRNLGSNVAWMEVPKSCARVFCVNLVSGRFH